MTSAGCLQALIPLANSGNAVGKAIAAQALAKITITTNPNIAFPGQRVGAAGSTEGGRGGGRQGGREAGRQGGEEARRRGGVT